MYPAGIVLLAVVDADYNFRYVDVGTNGRVSDGGTFKKSSLGKALEEGTVRLPQAEPLPNSNSNSNIPYYLVADDAFPLKPYLMKPYAYRGMDEDKRIANYRMSRGRRISENGFGILASRFQV